MWLESSLNDWVYVISKPNWISFPSGDYHQINVWGFTRTCDEKIVYINDNLMISIHFQNSFILGVKQIIHV